MASRLSTGPPARPEQARPEPGQILIVIHDFSARSSDELSLSKGDRVELIERDDDFGDGWYLGRHLMNGASGLFPEVYTRTAPRGPPSYPPLSSALPRPNAISKDTFDPILSASVVPPALPIAEKISQEDESSSVKPDLNQTSQVTPLDTATEAVDRIDLTSTSTPLTNTQDSDKTPQLPSISTASPMQPKSVTATKLHAHGQDSPVMNETLSVIDEHITDMNTPHHSMLSAERRGTNDSGSEYSSHIDHRLSYINGEETDEEEELTHTVDEVSSWSSDQVAEYLFTAGVETKHCEVFRDQEITGDVLLGMDQTSVFLKEFELGSVGRRLKTWQKIKALQDEVNGESTTRRNTGTYGSEISSDDAGRFRSRSINSSTVLPRIPSMMDRPGSRQNSRLSQQQTPRIGQSQEMSPISPKTVQEYSRPTTGEKRPSAASVREMHHSRQNSIQEFGTSTTGAFVADSPSITPDTVHKKQPSFDRNWTMGSAVSPGAAIIPSRSLSSSGVNAIGTNSPDQMTQGTAAQSNFDSLDRGYFSGGEADARQRNVLRKRGSTTTHSRNSSYTDEQRLRSATAHTRHSRFGSVDSIRETPPSASQKYYGLAVNGRRRTPSENSIQAPPRPLPPAKDAASPTVTKLDGSPYEIIPSPNKARGSDWLLPSTTGQNRAVGLRAISDAVTGYEKSRIGSPLEATISPFKESPVPSPSRTGSSTPSGGPSFDLDSPDAKSTSVMSTPGSARAVATRKKSKKETSAYTRGLEKKTPQEQMIGADYSGWMKKKSTNLMTTWKPRLFILKGRRLSYYYSENDDQEKGLIDISFHRVLPADTDRLTGLHATLTGATNSPTSPSGSQTATIAAVAAAAEPESTLSKSTGDSMFIFKLVPPRAGLSRAVTFTKPTVHYFAVPNIKQGRLWMAALMKATIDRDDTKPITTTYQQKTISLAKARAMRHRPPALMNLDEHVDEEALKTPASDRAGLNIQGIVYDDASQERDSEASGRPSSSSQKAENGVGLSSSNGLIRDPEPQTA